MTSVIFGVGVGLVILITVWFIAICISLISLRTKRNIGNITIFIAAAFTIILLLIQRDTKTPTPQMYRIYDEVFIWRSSLLILLAISSTLGVVTFVVKHLMEPHIEHSFEGKSAAIRRTPRDITNNDEFVKHVLNSEYPVVVNFHAEWCEPCKKLTPKLKEMIGPLNDIDLAVVDVEKNPELVETFEVKAVPAVVALRNGHVVDKFIGLVEEDMITKIMEKLGSGNNVDAREKKNEKN